MASFVRLMRRGKLVAESVSAPSGVAQPERNFVMASEGSAENFASCFPLSTDIRLGPSL